MYNIVGASIARPYRKLCECAEALCGNESCYRTDGQWPPQRKLTDMRKEGKYGL